MNKKILFVLVCSLFIFINKNYAQYQKINSSGLDIYYRIFGKGNPVLIIGGGPGDNSSRYLSVLSVNHPSRIIQINYSFCLFSPRITSPCNKK